MDSCYLRQARGGLSIFLRARNLNKGTEKQMIPRRIVVCCILFLSIVAASSTSWAQFSSGIEGTVTDPSGAVVPGVTVTLKNEDTGVTQTLQTSDSGYF